MADGFHEKNMDKDQSVIFWFYHVFLRNIQGTYIDHIFLYHLLTQGQILLDFLHSSPSNQSTKAIELENKILPFLDSFLRISLYLGKI